MACLGPMRNGAGAALKPATYKWQVRCPTGSATTPLTYAKKTEYNEIRAWFWGPGMPRNV